MKLNFKNMKGLIQGYFCLPAIAALPDSASRGRRALRRWQAGQQKTRLSASFLTEHNAGAQHLGLSINILSQNNNNVKYVDPTGIEPANPDFSDLGVHQYQAHIKLLSQIFIFFAIIFFFPSPALATNSNNFTFSLWVKPTSSVASKTLIGKAEEFRMFTNASGLVGCQIKATTWQTAAQATSKALTLNTWAHVVCTYDQVNLIVFVNGTKVATTPLSGAVDDTANLLKIGQDDSASTPYANLAGTIDEYKFYSYALTSDEVKTEFNQGKTLSLGGRSVNDSTPASLTNGLVGYWKMDEASWNGSANEVVDSSGNGKHGQSYNGISTTNGKFVNGGNFTVTNDYIQVSNFGALGGTSDFTVSTWIKPADVNSVRGIITQRCNFDKWAWAVNTTGKQKLYTTEAGAWTTDSNTSLTAGAWNHVAMVVGNSGTSVTFYLNGNADGIKTLTSISGFTNLCIGAWDTGTAGYANSIIDEARIYNRALSPLEVKQLYDWAPSTVAQWHLDENTGITATDTSGNSNNGTITGATYKPGKLGPALNFNGTSDYVDISNESNFDFANTTFTVEGWFKTTTTSASSVVAKHTLGGAGWLVTINGTANKLDAYIKDSTGANTAARSSSTSINDGKWHHFTTIITTDTATLGNNTISLYVDGKLDQGDITVANSPYSANDLTVNIGRRASGNYFNGSIDEVKVYNYARTPAEVAWDYNKGKPVAWWKMDECTGTAIKDSSGNSYSGTWSAGTTYTQAGTCTDGSSASAWYGGRTGKRNHSLDFDGTASNKVTIGTAINNVQSVSFWVKPTTNGDSFMDLDGGTHYITASSGTITATGFSSPTVYINGKSGGTITGGSWNHILITTATAFNTTTSFTLGYKSAATADYLTGQLDDVKIFNYPLTAEQVRNEYKHSLRLRLKRSLRPSVLTAGL